MADAPARTPVARVAPLVVGTVLVPLDGSEFAEEALEPASALARQFGAGMCVVGVGVDDQDLGPVAERLSEPAARFEASVELRANTDVAAAIREVARDHAPSLVVMTARSRRRVGGALFGSVAAAVLGGASDPVVLVGSNHDPAEASARGPVLACVDGFPASERSLPVAAAWAEALRVPLSIVTVAEPVPASFGRRHPRRAHGPEDPDGYIAGLAEIWRTAATHVSGEVIYDPISPVQGLAHHLSHRPGTSMPARLIVLATHARTGPARIVVGSQAAAIVRWSPLPVVAVPPR